MSKFLYRSNHHIIRMDYRVNISLSLKGSPKVVKVDAVKVDVRFKINRKKSLKLISEAKNVFFHRWKKQVFVNTLNTPKRRP
ncbi:MAG: hypothetical protein GY891_11830 [Bacteroidetes bacterium]|nr:hypothetical protein [Bacteroidota bacterium]